MTINKSIKEIIKGEIRPKIGQAERPLFKNIKFQRADNSSVPNIIVVWSKIFYSLYRGVYAGLDPNNFNAFQGNKVIIGLPGQEDSSIVDTMNDSNINAQYTVLLHPGSEGQGGTFPIEVSGDTCVSIFKRIYLNGEWNDWVNIMSSGDAPYQGGQVSIQLDGGVWTQLSVFIYKSSPGGSINALSGIYSIISSYDQVTSSLYAPNWNSPAITTELLDPNVGSAKNILHWTNIGNDLLGNGIYRYELYNMNITGFEHIGNQDTVLFKSTSYNQFPQGRDYNWSTSASKTLINAKLIKRNLINNGNLLSMSTVYPNEFIRGWQRLNTSKNVEIGLYYGDYMSGGNSMYAVRIATPNALTLKTSTVFAIDPNKDYNLSFGIRWISGQTAYPVSSVMPHAKLRFYTDNKGDYCVTTSHSFKIRWGKNNNTKWVNHRFGIQGANLPYTSTIKPNTWPSDCRYASLEFVFFTTASYAQGLAIDNIMLQEAPSDGRFTSSTVDAYVAKFSNSKTPASYTTQNTRLYCPLIDSLINIASPSAVFKSTGTPSFVSYSQLGSGLELGTKTTNHVKNPDFSTGSGYWTQIGTGSIARSTATYYFGTACGKVSRSTTASYIYALANYASVTGRTITPSLYYRASRGLRLKLQRTGGVVMQNTYLPTANSWTRYVAPTVTSASPSAYQYRFMVGYTTGEPGFSTSYGYFDGAQIESTSNVTNFISGTRSHQFCWSSPGSFSTSRGAISFYFTPNWGKTQVPGSKYLADLYRSATNHICLRYDGTNDRWAIGGTANGVGITELTINASAFSARDNLYFAYVWNSTTHFLYYKEPTKFASASATAPNLNSAPNELRIGKGTITDLGADGCFADVRRNYGLITSLDIHANASAGAYFFPLSLDVIRPQWRHIADRIIEHGEGQSVTYEDLGVAAGQTYTYALDSFDFTGMRSEMSDNASIIAGDNVPPGPVTATSSWGAFNTITMQWTNPDDADYYGARIFRGTGFSTPIGFQAGNPNEVNSFTATNLNSNTPYTFRIATLDLNQNINTSSAVSCYDTTYGAPGGDLTILLPPYNGAPRRWYTSNTSYTLRFYCSTAISTPLVSIRDHLNSELVQIYPSADASGPGGADQNWYMTWTPNVGYSEGSGIIYASKVKNGVRYEASEYFNIDYTAPTLTAITINNASNYTNSYSVKVSMTYSNGGTDPGPIDSVKFTGDLVSTGWFTFNGSTSVSNVSLTQGQGVHTINCRLRDIAGNISTVRTDTITVDLGAPTTLLSYSPAPFEILGPDGKRWWGSTISATLTTTDGGGSGVSKTWWRKKENVAAWTAATAYTGAVSFTTSGPIQFNYWSVDKAGNIEPENSYTFNLDRWDPVMNLAAMNATACVGAVKGAFIAWDATPAAFHDTAPGGNTNARSGIGMIAIYRSTATTPPANPAVSSFYDRVLSNVSTYYDYDENLGRTPGTVAYYAIRSIDYAGNYSSICNWASVRPLADWGRVFANWIDNGSFERLSGSNSVGWTSSGKAGRWTSTALFGTRGMFITATSYCNADYVYLPPYVANKRFILSVYNYDYSGNGGTLYAGIQLYNRDQFLRTYERSMGAVAQGENWVRHSIVVQSRSTSIGATATSMKLHIRSDSQNNPFIIDGIQWEEYLNTSSPSDFVDTRAISGDRMMAHFIRGDNIEAQTITADEIMANSITADKFQSFGGNLIPNSDFYLGRDGWNTAGGLAEHFTIASAYGYSTAGTLAGIRFWSDNGAMAFGVSSKRAIPVQRSLNYTLSGYINVSTAGNYFYTSLYFYKDQAGTIACTTTNAIMIQTGNVQNWTRHQKTIGPTTADATVVWPSDVRSVKVFIYVIGSATLRCKVTGFQLEKGTVAGPWRSVGDTVISGGSIKTGYIHVQGELSRIIIGGTAAGQSNSELAPGYMRYKGASSDASWAYYAKQIIMSPPDGVSSGARVTWPVSDRFYGAQQGMSSAEITPYIFLFPNNTMTYSTVVGSTPKPQRLVLTASTVTGWGFTPRATIVVGTIYGSSSWSVLWGLTEGQEHAHASPNRNSGNIKATFKIKIPYNCGEQEP